MKKYIMNSLGAIREVIDKTLTACELADELEACFTKADWEYVDDCVNMLRQQADRIAKLESCDKPVCWIREDGVVAFHEKPHIDSQNFKWFPLYTTPQTKPLSDEEIDKIASMCSVNEKDQINDREFARAIEERHGIK